MKHQTDPKKSAAKKSTRRSRTDWARLDAMKDEDTDTSDIPELGPEFFKNAIVWPGTKQHKGRRDQTTLSEVLRRHMEARNRKSARRVDEAKERKQ